MDWFYLFKLQYTLFICAKVEVPLFILPAFFLRFRVLNPMMRCALGSVDAAFMALDHGWAINLGGGYHHASRKDGGGFCIYPDITMIAHYLRKEKRASKILIIDLDAHQGNGHERDFIGD